MSDSVHILFIALTLLLITILIFRECDMKKNYIEKFGHDKPKSHVVLIGDDILNNIDYGYENSRNQNTLQSVKKHRYVNLNFKPGHSDITSHVNFNLFHKIFLAFLEYLLAECSR